jgi:hypothetical protein
MSETLNESGWSKSELHDLVSTQAPGRRDLIRFAEYLGQLDELSTLRLENERMTRVVAELSARILELESRALLLK